MLFDRNTCVTRIFQYLCSHERPRPIHTKRTKSPRNGLHHRRGLRRLVLPARKTRDSLNSPHHSSTQPTPPDPSFSFAPASKKLPAVPSAVCFPFPRLPPLTASVRRRLAVLVPARASPPASPDVRSGRCRRFNIKVLPLPITDSGATSCHKVALHSKCSPFSSHGRWRVRYIAVLPLRLARLRAQGERKARLNNIM